MPPTCLRGASPIVLLFIILTTIFLTVAYGYGVGYGTNYALMPYIRYVTLLDTRPSHSSPPSDTGAMLPERPVFTLLITLPAIVAPIIGYVRYIEVREQNKENYVRVRRLNIASIWTIFVACFGMILVGAFDVCPSRILQCKSHTAHSAAGKSSQSFTRHWRDPVFRRRRAVRDLVHAHRLLINLYIGQSPDLSLSCYFCSLAPP